MGTVSLSLIVLKTRQVDNLRTFYTSLGIHLTAEQHGKGPIHYAGRVGDVVLEIYPLPDDGAAADTTTRLGFVVERLAGVMQALQTFGTSVVAEPRATEWGLKAVVRDPDGRAVEIYHR